jgi:hypothetical protein
LGWSCLGARDHGPISLRRVGQSVDLRKMQASGSSAGTAHHVHRTIRVALGEAVRRGHVPTNVAEIAKAPRLEEEDIEPYTRLEAAAPGRGGTGRTTA